MHHRAPTAARSVRRPAILALAGLMAASLGLVAPRASAAPGQGVAVIGSVMFESDSSLTFTLRAPVPANTGMPAGDITGTFATRPLSIGVPSPFAAQPGTDYVSLFESVTLSAPSFETTVTVLLADDEQFELPEVIVGVFDPDDPADPETRGASVIVSEETDAGGDCPVGPGIPVGGAPCEWLQEVTGIGVPSFSVGDAAADEGDSGTTMLSFPVSRDHDFPVPLDIAYETADGTAGAGSDYTAASGTLTFEPGEMSKTVLVSVTGDTKTEDDETFTLEIHDQVPDTTEAGQLDPLIADGTGAGTIQNDDPMPTVSVSGPAQVTEGDTGTTTASFTVSLSGESQPPVTVDYATAGGSAEAGTDYQSTSGTLTFTEGQLTKPVTVTVEGDATFEGDEDFHVDLSNPSRATLGAARATTVISNDDTAPTPTTTTTTTSTTTTTTTTTQPADEDEAEVRGVTVQSTAPRSATTPSEKGYWILGPDGRVHAFGDAEPLVGAAAVDSSAKLIGLASNGQGGLWVVDEAGGVHARKADYFGSIPGRKAEGAPIGEAAAVDIAAAPGGDGYVVLDDSGGVHNFGDAAFLGSMPGRRARGHDIGPAQAVDIAYTPSGMGYVILDESGGIHTFGDARYFGSIHDRLAAGQDVAPIRYIALSLAADGSGYWLLDARGGVHGFGRAPYHGSLPGLMRDGVDVGPAAATDLEVKTDGSGYWVFDSVGGVFAFGGATFEGSVPGRLG